VIERDPLKAAELTDKGVIVLVRDATLEETLREAGIENARGLAACLPNDADNVYVVLTARDLNSRIHIVARAAEEQAEGKLVRAGAKSRGGADTHWRSPNGSGFDKARGGRFHRFDNGQYARTGIGATRG